MSSPAQGRPARPFIHEDFLLAGRAAERLYHEVAAVQPIIDYHCHLSPEFIADNHRFRSMTEIWLDGDHYKWRAMRANGVSERLCTGEASDEEKFSAWAATVPRTLRNPLYHWTHLELAFPFGIRDRLLSPETAAEIYAECNGRLAEPSFTAQGLLAQYNVKVVCTTDDPVDSLDAHTRHGRTPQSTILLPTWRPDEAFGLEDLVRYGAWLDKLEACSGLDVRTYDELLSALEHRHSYFHAKGCRLSDRGLDTVPSAVATPVEARDIFARARRKEPVAPREREAFKGLLLLELGRLDHSRGWVQQLHMGALRRVNSRMTRAVGWNTGFDTIGDASLEPGLSMYLDALDCTGQLPKTIVYNLNPKDNDYLAAMVGNFQDGSVPGKLQYGSAWWFLDQLDGMEKQINAISNQSLLSRFVGMLTDSRSFLSYSRHEYFRRLLCSILGQEMDNGRLPQDFGLVGALVKDVCYENARRYFGFDL